MALLPPFAQSTPFSTGRLDVSKIHNIAFEQHGNPAGMPLLALHGGPGTGISRMQLRTIDPTIFNIVTFDQRGSGRSTPFAETRENTTQDLVADIERLREHLGIERWVVTGRSWGSTLALTYAITHPERVTALIPVAVFLGRDRDTEWIYQHGASEVFPEDWQDFIDLIPEQKRHNMLGAISDMIANGSPDERLEAARRLGKWELCTLWLVRGPSFNDLGDDDTYTVGTGVLETHYLSQQCFLPGKNWILENASKLNGLPGAIVHARYDMNCRVGQAYELHKAWENSTLEIVEAAGHAQDEPGNVDACIRTFRSIARDL